MQKEYEIIGQHNNLLAMIFEALDAGNKNYEKITAKIVHLEKTPFDLFCGSEYKVETIDNSTVYVKEWTPNPKACKFVLAEGSRDRENRWDLIEKQYDVRPRQHAIIIHPTASIASTATIEPGTYIGPNSSVGPYAVIKQGCWINRNVSIGHHTILSKFSTLNPGSNIGGKCTIGECVTIGMGANVFDHVVIGGFSVIGGGSVVTKSVGGASVFYGNPVKFIRKINID